MKQLLIDLYWDSVSEMDKIKKNNLSLSDRIALETAKTKMEMAKKILNITDVTLK